MPSRVQLLREQQQRARERQLRVQRDIQQQALRAGKSISQIKAEKERREQKKKIEEEKKLQEKTQEIIKKIDEGKITSESQIPKEIREKQEKKIEEEKKLQEKTQEIIKKIDEGKITSESQIPKEIRETKDYFEKRREHLVQQKKISEYNEAVKVLNKLMLKGKWGVIGMEAKYGTSSMKKLARRALKERRILQEKELKEQEAKLPIIKEQEKYYQSLGYSKSESEFLAQEGARQQMTFLKTRADELLQQRRIESIFSPKVTAPETKFEEIVREQRQISEVPREFKDVEFSQQFSGTAGLDIGGAGRVSVQPTDLEGRRVTYDYGTTALLSWVSDRGEKREERAPIISLSNWCWRNFYFLSFNSRTNRGTRKIN